MKVGPGWVELHRQPSPQCRWCGRPNVIAFAIVVVCVDCDHVRDWPKVREQVDG